MQKDKQMQVQFAVHGQRARASRGLQMSQIRHRMDMLALYGALGKALF